MAGKMCVRANFAMCDDPEFGARIASMHTPASQSYASDMKQPNFRIVPLRTEVADAARRAVAAGAADHTLVTADSPRGYPCRHCLQWANPGERMILFTYAAVENGPYKELGPIFVHAEPCAQYSAVTNYPAEFRNGRVIRAYDERTSIIDARVVNGEGPEAAIEELLQNERAAFLHVRSVGYGCYTMGVERV